MKNIFTIILLILIHSTVFCQIKFEKGYFIDNDNKRTECYIKNVDWKNNPTSFDVKITENAEKETKNIENVKIFAIQNYSKYLRANVNMDTSSPNFNDLNHNKAPQYKRMNVFLKVLVEDSSTLYYYEKGNLKRFFAQFKSEDIEPLIYKQYINGKDGVTENAQFRQYLSNKLKCSQLEFRDFELLKYNESDLVRLFEKYNSCLNPNSTTKKILSTKKVIINVKALFGINRSSFDFHYISGFSKDILIPFANKITPHIGVEIESILPFNKNKWSLFSAPNYTFYKVQSSSNTKGLAYHAIEIPVNIRYYMFFNSKSCLFINSGVTVGLPFKKTIDVEGYAANIDTAPSFCFNFGIGYSYDIWSIELRNDRPKNILDTYRGLYSKFLKSSLILAYKF